MWLIIKIHNTVAMPLTDYRPQFPYKENQIILTSDRVVLHSSKDSIFLFGKKAVSLSTTGTVNVDANIGLTVATPTIELGADAKLIGHPVIRSKDFVEQLNRVLLQLQNFAGAIQELKSEEVGFAQAVTNIVAQALLLQDVTESVIAVLPSTYSTTTYTT